MAGMKPIATVTLLTTALLLTLAAHDVVAQDKKAAPEGATPARVDTGKVPPGADGALERVNTSPRHGEWAKVNVEGLKTPMRTYVVYPEVKEKAPVVIVI